MTLLSIDRKTYDKELARYTNVVDTYAAMDPANIAIHGLGDILIVSLRALQTRAERASSAYEMSTCYNLMQRVPSP